MFASILSTTLTAIAVAGIFTASTPLGLAAATYLAGFSIIDWGLNRNRG